MVGHRHSARHRHRAPADQPHLRDGMMELQGLVIADDRFADGESLGRLLRCFQEILEGLGLLFSLAVKCHAGKSRRRTNSQSCMPSHELTPYFWQIERSSTRIE
jgi:hypothetical protein